MALIERVLCGCVKINIWFQVLISNLGEDVVVHSEDLLERYMAIFLNKKLMDI